MGLRRTTVIVVRKSDVLASLNAVLVMGKTVFVTRDRI
jgi:hypothetical protein